MKCPECDGIGTVLIGTVLIAELNGSYTRLPCPSCDGEGEIPEPTGNNCPACGEPIPLNKKWCEFHKAAENLSE